MSFDAALVYLEADDEITAVVRRVRAADATRVVVVAPGRSRATSSVVALRLLARAATADEREVVVVGDALTRSLAAEAGLGAFGTVDEARSAEPGAPPATGVPTAMIHVVRGPVDEDTAPTLAAAAAVPAMPSGAGPDDVTRPVPVARGARRAAMARPTASRPRALPVAGVAMLVLLLVGALVVGAVVLPAATITIVPRTDPVGPVDYTLAFDEPDVASGTAEATATVVATGSYEVLEPATGTVVLFNWTFFPVSVPAGTFVAAGEQAFATQADVTVPRGRLTPQGTIAAGDVSVAVVAAAPGPAANVAANAINVVVNESIDDRLGGVPENPEPRVLNPEPTSGGADEQGPEITPADVESAVASLRDQLDAQVVEAGRPDDETLTVTTDPSEPTITGTEGLAGTRDEPEVEIGGSQAWMVLRVPRADVAAEAQARLRDDPSATPGGHQLLVESIEVSVQEARREGSRVVVDVTVIADSTAAIDPATVAERVAGLTPDAARVTLADLGAATIELWPGWVATVPSATWRVDVRIEGDPAEPSSSAEPSASAEEGSP